MKKLAMFLKFIVLGIVIAFVFGACGKEFICENAKTCEAIGKIYIYGYRGDSADYYYPSPQELKQAKAFFQKACDLNSANGCMELGFALRAIQKGVKHHDEASSTDSEEIARVWKKACEIDETPGYVCLGIGLFYSNDESPIIAKLKRDYLTRACELSYYEGEAVGRTRLQAPDVAGDSCYLAGQEWFKTDKQKAIAIYEEACEYADGLSCEELGRIYEEGLGVKADTKRAKGYCEKAEMYGVKNCRAK